jgi:hypothetical protein
METATTSEPTFALAAFEAAVGTRFVVRLEDGAKVDLTLVAVEPGRSRPGWECFSLLFDGPTPPAITQSTSIVEHASLGTFHLFLGPVLADEGSPSYEAVFNRKALEVPSLRGVDHD